MTIFRFSLLLLPVVASCGQAQNDRICSSPPERPAFDAEPSGSVGEQMIIADSCVHNWAYRLANGSQSTEIVARATIEACRDAIHREAQMDQGARTELYGGDYNRQIKETEQRYFENALYRAVQAKAGNCQVK